MEENKRPVLVVEARCPMCKSLSQMELVGSEISRLDLYEMGMFSVQDLFPGWNPFERELLITGYCVTCQSKLFGRKIPKDVRVKTVINPSL